MLSESTLTINQSKPVYDYGETRVTTALAKRDVLSWNDPLHEMDIRCSSIPTLSLRVIRRTRQRDSRAELLCWSMAGDDQISVVTLV